MNELLSLDLHIFDLDDTLINTRHSYHLAQESALTSVFPNLTEDVRTEKLDLLRWLCQSFGSGNVKQYMDAFLKTETSDCKDNSELRTQMMVQYETDYWSHLSCLPGVNVYLELLRSQNKHLVLVSNGSLENQRKKLVKTGLDSFFEEETCYISGQFPSDHKKPSPRMILLAYEATAIPSSQAVFYGNTINDLLAGNLAGVRTVLIGLNNAFPEALPGIGRPTYTWETWDEGEPQPYFRAF